MSGADKAETIVQQKKSGTKIRIFSWMAGNKLPSVTIYFHHAFASRRSFHNHTVKNLGLIGPGHWRCNGTQIPADDHVHSAQGLVGQKCDTLET